MTTPEDHDQTETAAELPTQSPARSFNRRAFLAAGLGATGVVVGGAAMLRSPGSPSKAAAPSGPADTGTTSPSVSNGSTGAPAARAAAARQGAPSSTKASDRRLVVIELDGGNDGMSTLVPYGIAGYRDLRKRLAIDDKDLLHLKADVALHRNLEGLHDRGLAVLQGVGSPNPDGSHFAMMERWWRGDVTGKANPATGFLGRLCDAIGDPAAAIVGLSIGSGSHPALVSAKAPTMSIPGAESAGYLVGADKGDTLRVAFQSAFASMSAATDGPPGLSLSRRGSADAVSVARMLQGLGHDDHGKDAIAYPGSNLGNGLRLTARLLAADTGVRIVHVPMGADFDTHHDHPNRHPGLLTELNDAVVAFLDDLDRRGLHDQVLVMTTSEFGRTARDNASNGLDHGTASVAMLLGPVKAGIHGEHPSLTKLDDNDDLVATVGFDAYYATVAERWFGVPATDVLLGAARAIDGLLAV